MEALNTNAERQALRACELEAFKAIKLDALKDKVAQLLAHIGDGGIFDQYTKHDITHVNKMLESLDNIIPASTQDVMTAADWILIVVSTYLSVVWLSLQKVKTPSAPKGKPIVPSLYLFIGRSFQIPPKYSSGIFDVTFKVACDNQKPQLRTVRLQWDGMWRSRKQELFNGFAYKWLEN